MNRERADELLTKAGWLKLTKEAYIERRTKGLRAELEKAAVSDTLSVTSTDAVAIIQKQIDERLNAEIPSAQTTFRAKKDDVLQLTITTVSDQELTAVAERAAAHWRDIGVQTTVRAVNPRDVASEVLRPGTYEVLLYGEIIGADPDPFPFWHSSQVDYPGLNLANFVNRKADT
ncbi:MAG: hypothetical protein AAB912_01100, partial [Patescibacteria group bacterium]